MRRHKTPATTPRAPRAFVALFFGLASFGCSSNEPPPPTAQDVPPPALSPSPQPTTPNKGLIADDGHTLWASPTKGPSIGLAGIADGSELILHLRPTLLMAKPEGQRVWQALSSLCIPCPSFDGSAAVGEAIAPPNVTNMPKEGRRKKSRALTEIDHLVITVAPGETYGVVKTTIDADPTPTKEPPRLRREIEQLLVTSDADRQATLIVSPGFLLGDGGPLVGGAGAPLRRLLQEYARDDWKAMALSFHIEEEKIYWELRIIGSPDTPELTRARQLAKTMDVVPAELASLIAVYPWSNYSEAFLKQTPAMLEVASRYTRRGAEERQAVLNGYLPAKAAHNVALAAELLVAELSAGTSASSLEQEEKGTTLVEKLRQPVTIAFDREPMESALRILTNTLSARLKIIGRDLQLEGITRNQMLSLDVHEKSAEDALVELLRQANPNPLATGPADPRQKLVYVLREETILITTRAATKRRNELLPAVFTN